MTLGLFLGLVLPVALAWTDPTQAPPNANVAAPLRVGSATVTTDSSTNKSIWVNKTGASGNIVELQKNGTAKLVIENDGDVGIGTTSPGDKLSVVGGSISAKLDPSLANNTGIVINPNTTDNPQQTFRASDNSVRFTLDALLNATTTNDLLTFKTVTVSTALVIKGDGNVGIGTTAPGRELTIGSSDGDASIGLTTPGTGAAHVTHVNLLSKDADGDGYFDAGVGVDKGFHIGAYGNLYSATDQRNDLQFYKYDNGWSAPILVIDGPTGNVGIGTTAPTSALQVNGAIRQGTGGYIIGEPTFGTRINNSADTLNVVQFFNSGGTAFGTYAGTDPGADKVIIPGDVRIGDTAANAERLYVNTAANALLRLRSALDAGRSIDISYQDTPNVFQFSTSATGGYAFMNGNVGIGTTAPTGTETYSLLTIEKSNATAHQASIINTGAGQVGLVLRRTGTTPQRWYTYIPDGTTDLRFYDGTTDQMFFYAGGSVGIGADAPNVDKLVVWGDVRVGTGTTGCVKDRDATVIAGTCSSDLRLKKDIVPLGSVLGNIVSLQPVSFRWRADEHPDLHLGTELELGLVAQEVEEVMPELVADLDNGFKGVRYEKLPLLLLQAVKELNEKVDALARGAILVAELVVDKLSVKAIEVQEILDLKGAAILHAPNGSCFRVTVDNSGALTSAPAGCP